MTHLQMLHAVNAKAASDMVTQIAAGVHAGNNGMTADCAAKIALETAEEILSGFANLGAGN